jgi:hypothetical protein
MQDSLCLKVDDKSGPMVSADVDDGSEAHVLPGTECSSSAMGSVVMVAMGSVIMAAIMKHSDQGWNKVGAFTAVFLFVGSTRSFSINKEILT